MYGVITELDSTIPGPAENTGVQQHLRIVLHPPHIPPDPACYFTHGQRASPCSWRLVREAQVGFAGWLLG